MLDGWAWNEFEALPLPWFSGLATLLYLVETTGVWPQGLLDGYIAMIPKADGDSTSWVNGPLSVLSLVVYKLWASLRLGDLRDWVEGRLPQSVFSLGNGLSSVEAWFSTALDIEEVFSETAMSWSLMSSSPLTLWTGPFWIALWGGSVCLTGFEGLIFLIIVRFDSGLSLLLVLVSLGEGMMVSLRAVL